MNASPLFGACLIAAAGLLTGGRLAATTTISVDVAKVHKVGVDRIGLNVCWLLDSDRLRPTGRSTSDALAEFRPGALRFPYGHLADNYLWNSAAGGETGGALRPRVASLALPPGGWSWAVKPDGSMPDAMDFDEFLRLCAKVGAKPVVCVNALSFKYPGGPSYEALKASAVAWVKYAARRSPRVAYWEIGNEVDLKPNAALVPFAEYVKLYGDFAAAMKAADPSAHIGPGVDNNPKYYRALLEQYPALVDFAVVHQYEWSQKACATYDGWRDDSGNYIRNLEGATKALTRPDHAPVKLMVTETGVSGGPALGETANTYRALWLAELLLNETADPAVDVPMFWGTHTPWEFHGFDTEPRRDVALALTLRDNARTPMGEVIKLINDAVLDTVLELPRVAGRLRTYAMRNAATGEVAVLLLNKDNAPAEVDIALAAAGALHPSACTEFAGRTPDDRHPTVRARPLPPGAAGRVAMTLAPLSLTVVRFTSHSP